jgi:eukaryotic-like serine/threonine-protein kinase
VPRVKLLEGHLWENIDSSSSLSQLNDHNEMMASNKHQSTSLQPGKIIGERFRVKKTLGQGGQGEVYLVEDTIENNSYKALKTLRKGILPQKLQRMKTEVAALKSIDSRYVLRLESTNLDTYEQDSDEVPYFVTELAKYDTLTKHNYYVGEIEISLKLFRGICEGVMAIHKAGIIHRDLKPSNILLMDNEKDVRIGDFGICYINWVRLF